MLEDDHQEEQVPEVIVQDPLTTPLLSDTYFDLNHPSLSLSHFFTLSLSFKICLALSARVAPLTDLRLPPVSLQ